MNKCVICGKMYEPYRCYGERQLTCSAECRKEYGRQYARTNPKRYEYMEKTKERARQKRNGHVICRICGKPICRTFEMGEGSPWMHFECVMNDCVNTIRAGEQLSRKQISRLDARGYSIAEFMEEYRDEIEAGEVHAC